MRIWAPRALCSRDRKSTRLNSSHQINSYAVFCLKKKKNNLQSGIFITTERHHHSQANPRPVLRGELGRGATNGVGRGLPWHERGEFFFFNDTATTEIYTLSLHDALPI